MARIASIVAYALSLLTTVALILLMAAGSSPNALRQLTLFNVDIQGLRVSSPLASSEFLRGLQTISGTDLTGGELDPQQLGLPKSFAVYIYTICSHFYDGSKTCSKFKVGQWFNPQKAFGLQERGLPVTFSSGYRSAADFYANTSYYLGIGVILALVASILSFASGGLAIYFPRLRLLPAVMSLLAAVLLAAEAPLAFRTSRRMTSALESELDVGIHATLGQMVYFLFATMAVSFFTTAMHFFSSGWRRNDKPSRRPRHPRFDGPAHDSAGVYHSGFDKSQPLKQMLPWRSHKYEKVDEQRARERPISMEPLRPQDEGSPLRPVARY